MTRQAVVLRHQPRRRVRRVGEFAGGTTAECAAVCCCCPCALLEILVLALIRLPAAACRRVLRRRRPPRRSSAVKAVVSGEGSPAVMSLRWDSDVMRVENEMLDRFDRGGFWRCPEDR